jgi:hypothetical protein
VRRGTGLAPTASSRIEEEHQVGLSLYCFGLRYALALKFAPLLPVLTLSIETDDGVGDSTTAKISEEENPTCV